MKADPTCENCTEDCAQCAANAGVTREEPMKEVSDGLANSATKRLELMRSLDLEKEYKNT